MSSAIGEMLRKIADRAYGEKTKKLAGPYVVDDPIEPCKSWAVASDGKIIVWTRDWQPTLIPTLIDEKAMTMIRSLFAPPRGCVPTWEGRLDELRTFCGAPHWSDPCPECEGRSKASEYVFCSYCDNDGEVLPDARCGFVCGIGVNLIYLANVLERFPTDAIVHVVPDVREDGHKAGKGSRVWVIGRDFRVCLMCMTVAKSPADELFEVWKTAPSFPIRP